MTHTIYSHQQLQLKSIARLKQIYSEIGCTVEVSDKRCKDAWITAIISHQSAQLQKIDEQALAQAELNRHIADQANVIAPDKLTIVEISFYDQEYYADNQLIAAITHDADDFATQRWVVMVNGAEVHRATTPMQCHRYICTHYKDASLPVQEEAGGQGAGSKGEQDYQQYAAPVQDKELANTGNEIMAQIFNECEQHGLELLDDGIYTSDGEKLGEVGCTEGKWWAIRASSDIQQKVACDSVEEAVRRCEAACRETSLLVNPVCCDELLDRAFDELTTDEWWRLLESEADNSELIAA
ncbi:MAG: hypothetical protein KME32_30450 [Mojavia pulchra JT2-VF2]|jgi:hypothetical protein|uniref:Uncharacterized protein n=1 Tax=Mojavia pulchra JT2-VF2 TaxID=287848 RepID=A0A951Q647_9NOST|nr:hypothetical protein [Mojavia pulchra JT2-VF2]